MYKRRVVVCVMFFISAVINAQGNKQLRLALQYESSYKIDSCYWYLQKAVRLCKHAPERQQALIYLHYGKVLKLREETDSSFIYMNRAEKIYSRLNMKDSLLYVKASVAELFRFRILKEQALHYITEAEKLLNKNTPVNIRAYCYSRRASIESMFYSKAKSKELSVWIVAHKDEITDKEIVVYSYNELAFFLEEAKKIKQAKQMYLDALAIAESNNLTIPAIDVLLNLNRIVLNEANGVDKEIVYLEKALKLAYAVNNDNYKNILHTILMSPYEKKGNYKAAFYQAVKAMNIRNSISEDKRRAEIAEIERKYNIGVKENEIRAKNKEVKSAHKTIVLIGIIFGLTVVVLFMVAFLLRRTHRSNKELARLSKENEFLLSEANHRINNNLQLIIVLINDELRKLSREENTELKKVLSKVESIATLHRHLYKSENKQQVNCREYLAEILDSFAEIFQANKIQLVFNADDISVRTETAMYLGLLLTELCINSIKHAFYGVSTKCITFELKGRGDSFGFRYSDNGTAAKGSVLKPRLVERLCRQLRVACNIDTHNGFLFYFEKKSDAR